MLLKARLSTSSQKYFKIVSKVNKEEPLIIHSGLLGQ